MFGFLFCVIFINSLAFSQESCSIQPYRSRTCLDNRPPIIHIDQGFQSSMNAICAAANRCNVKLLVTSAYRKSNSSVTDAIVQPADRSNHLVGHAIDMNVVYGAHNFICNSACLRGNSKPREVQCFLNQVQQNGLRWGGTFTTSDPVHIDDAFNINQNQYDSLYKSIQKQC